MKGSIKSALGLDKIGSYLRENSEKMKVLAAQPMVRWIKERAGKLDNIQNAEFSAFSQWGDDGIIQYLIHTLQIKNQTFIEFGVGNYLEANTRFLLLNDNWRGLIMDGSKSNINFVLKDSISWKHSISAIHAFITRDNVNSLIRGAGFEGEIGILHIDVDGNDYWFWEAIDQVNPIIVIMEYNSLFGSEHAITVPYKPDFFVTKEHFSNLYFGASLKALNHLAEKKGYTLVGSNSNGNNAFFVRNDRLGMLKRLSVEESYMRCRFRQNKNREGNLTFKDDFEMIAQCYDLPVLNIENDKMDKLSVFVK